MQDAQTNHINNAITQPDITVRLFANPKLAQTYGKGLRHSVIYNGSVEIQNHHYRYLVDLCSHNDWIRTSNPNSEDEKTIMLAMLDYNSKDHLFSWVQQYDQATKQKQRITGFCHYNLIAGTMDMLIADGQLCESWKLAVKPCLRRAAGVKSPDLIATNVI